MNYPVRLVAFVDVLGFSELIRAASDGPDAFATINLFEDLLKEEGAWESKADDATVRMFSDPICLSDSPDFGGFFRLVIKLWTMQVGFLKRDILLRGGVSIGRHYESDTLIFSQGLVSAYRLEASRAIYPRIIVDRPVLERCLAEAAADQKAVEVVRGLLLRDVDHEVFVNYLGVHSESDADWEAGRIKVLERQARLIAEGRLKFRENPGVLQKLGWLERYHNFVATNAGASDLLVGAGAIGFATP